MMILVNEKSKSMTYFHICSITFLSAKITFIPRVVAQCVLLAFFCHQMQLKNASCLAKMEFLNMHSNTNYTKNYKVIQITLTCQPKDS